MASTIRCIAGGSAGAPAPFRARTAGKADSLMKVLALPAESCWAAACAACASATASATTLWIVTSCARRRALACCGPFGLLRGMVLWALRGVVLGGGRLQTRATGARGTWGPAGAHGSTGGRQLRGPRGGTRELAHPRGAGAPPPSPCACASMRVVQARGTWPPGRSACTCWCPSVPRRTPCHTLRRGGRCVGGGRPVTRG